MSKVKIQRQKQPETVYDSAGHMIWCGEFRDADDTDRVTRARINIGAVAVIERYDDPEPEPAEPTPTKNTARAKTTSEKE